MKTTRLQVSGMTCSHCREAVQKALLSSNGVRTATVDLDGGTAEVEYEEDRVAPEQLIAAVQEEGYHAAIAGNS